MRRHVASKLAVVVGIGASIVAPATMTVARGATDAVSWGSCPAGAISAPAKQLPRAAELQCAALTVPLDYRQPGGKTITVETSRLPSASPKVRRGVMLLNPGGPGFGGLDLPLFFAAAAPGLGDSYDLIGFDPRGVGQSTPVRCGLPLPQRLAVAPAYPLAGGVPANAELAKQVADQCAARAGGLLPYITTANTARDMDRIRVTLGEDRISYLGGSYGTYLGVVYASLFPQRIDRMLFDSNVDPTGVWRGVVRNWGPAAEIRFPDFAKWAAARDDTYGLGATPRQVRETYFSLAARLDVDPQNGFTGNRFRSQTRSHLFSDSAFADLAELWQQVSRGEAEAPPTSGPGDNYISVFLGIMCDDARWPRSVSRYTADVAHDAEKYPIAGAMAANILPCAFWPTQPVEHPIHVSDQGPRNILLLNNLRDPATPYFGALMMRRALGARATLVSVDQGGHGVYLATENTCATKAATQWLIDGLMPRSDIRCPATTAASARAPMTRLQQQAVHELQSRAQSAVMP